MDNYIVIIVLIILFILLGGAAWFFGKEAGPGNGLTWLTGSRQFRNMVQPFSSTSRALEHRTQTPMMIDSGINELTDELRGEVTNAFALAEKLDQRLGVLEQEVGQTRQLPQTIDDRVHQHVQQSEATTNTRIKKLRDDFNQSRKANSPYNQKRNDAVGKLYQRLAQLEVSLGTVINPMLLPGEPVSVPDSLHEDTLQWENWGDVADRAFAFGEMFSQNRFLLQPELAAQIEEFISNFRDALTGTVYPIVQEEGINNRQKAKMREGIITVTEEISPLRREFEHAWQHGTAMTDFTEKDDDDLD